MLGREKDSPVIGNVSGPRWVYSRSRQINRTERRNHFRIILPEAGVKGKIRFPGVPPGRKVNYTGKRTSALVQGELMILREKQGE